MQKFKQYADLSFIYDFSCNMIHDGVMYPKGVVTVLFKRKDYKIPEFLENTVG